MQKKIFLLSIAFLTVFCECARAKHTARTKAEKEQINIIPLPKQMRDHGGRIYLNTVPLPHIVVGQHGCEQARIGADWINRRIVELAGKPLPVVNKDALPPDATTLVIDTSGAGKPGERGYNISFSKDRKRILLAGADPVGALYACVTLAKLLECDKKGVYLRTIYIQDWPDVIYAGVRHHHATCGGLGNNLEIQYLLDKFGFKKAKKLSHEAENELLNAYKRYIDSLLRYKIAMVNFSQPPELWYKWFDPKIMKKYDFYREAIRYANARGVNVTYWGVLPFVGLKSKFPKYAHLGLPTAIPRYKHWIRSWGMDEIRAKTAQNVAEYIKYMGFKDIYFHDADTGQYLDPAQWSARSNEDRRRWKDDYAGATLNKFNIYLKALKKIVPGVKVHLTFIPYTCDFADLDALTRHLKVEFGATPGQQQAAKKIQKQYSDFFKKIADNLPGNATIVVRETDGAARVKFNKIIKNKPVYTWYAVNCLSPLYSPTVSWLGGMLGNRQNAIVPMYCDEVVPFSILAVREYTWNSHTPGIRPWGPYNLAFDPSLTRDYLASDKFSNAAGKRVLSRVVKSIFGKELAPYITATVSRKLIYKTLFGYSKFSATQNALTKSTKFLSDQVIAAEKGVLDIDAAWKKATASPKGIHLDAVRKRYLIYLRELFHSSMWMAKIRYQSALAYQLASKGNKKEAEAAVRKGLEFVETAQKEMTRLIAERGNQAIFKHFGGKKNIKPGSIQHKKWKFLQGQYWYGQLADGADFSFLKEELNHTLKNMAVLCAAIQPPQKVLKLLVKADVLAVRRKGEIKIDGILNEADWSTAYPRESFLELNKEGINLVGTAETRTRTLYDNNRLYIAFECWRPSHSGQDVAEVFVKAPDGEAYVHLKFSPNGSVYMQKGDRLNTKNAMVATPVLDSSWKCSGLKMAVVNKEDGKWVLEFSAPWSSLGIKRLSPHIKVNYARHFRSGGIISSVSSIMNPKAKGFHDTSKFKRLCLMGNQSFAPDMTTSITNFKRKVKVRTVGISTIAQFGLKINSSQVLHNVKITGETYDENGKLNGSATLAKIKNLPYRWQSSIPLELNYIKTVEKGGVKISIKADEGSMAVWAVFGGWKGAPDLVKFYETGIEGKGRIEPCFFPSMLKGGKMILNPMAGTVEFWFKPSWGQSFAIYHPAHSMMDYGSVTGRAWDAYSAPLLIGVFKDELRGTCQTAAGLGDAFHSIRNYRPWKNVWRHVAVVWDSSAPVADSFRLYLDGKKVGDMSPGRYKWNRAKWKISKPVRVAGNRYFPIQLGARVDGLSPGVSVIDNFRISRIARYTKNFVPQQNYGIDKDVNVFFDFNGTLEGQGIDSNGKKYKVKATSGIYGNR